jgi:hypothetical protein
MGKFLNTIVNDKKVWGYFEDEPSAIKAIHDIKNVLNGKDINIRDKVKKYVTVIAFGDFILPSINGYTAQIINSDGMKILTNDAYYPSKDSVLVLGPTIVDDYPKFITAQDFCDKMNATITLSYFIPL